jgi:lysozyme
MQLSRAGAAFIASWEAIYLEAYPDPGTNGEPITIGIGATAATGLIRPRLGDIIPLSRALSLFDASMRKYEAAVSAAIKLALSQAQYDALVSFHYNTGAIHVGSVDDRLNAGNVSAALSTMARYTRSGGRVMSGLEDRRRQEVALFRTGVYPHRKILIKDRIRSAGRLLDPSQFAWRNGG